MIKNTTYTCDVCGKTYQTQSGAENCEQSHRTQLYISTKLYDPSHEQSTDTGFPSSVIITDEETGLKVMYTYSHYI